NSYDVARAQFSGGVVASTTRGGTNVPQGSFTYALRDRSLAWGETTASPFGQGATQNQLGGGMGGPIVPNKLFVFAALQGRWRAQALPSLTTADPGTLAQLGVSPDSAARFLALPAAVVDVASDLPNGGQGVAALAFGGSWGLPQHIHNRSLEIADEFSWLPGRTAHRLKLGMDVIGTRVDEGQTANQLGTFIY